MAEKSHEVESGAEVKLISMSGLVPMLVEYSEDSESKTAVIFFDFANGNAHQCHCNKLSGNLANAVGEMVMQEHMLPAPEIPIDVVAAMAMKDDALKSGLEQGVQDLDERVSNTDKD